MSLSEESKQAIQAQQVKARLEEMTNISRLSVNTLNLLCSNDITIPSAYAKPVAEIQAWLEAMHKAVQEQINTLNSILPAEATKVVPEVKPEAVEATVVA